MAQDSGSVSGDVNSDFVQWQFILSVPRSFSFLTSTMGSNLGSDTEESDVETIPLRLKKELHPPLRWPVLLPEGSEHSSKASFP